MERDKVYLQHILAAIKSIEKYTRGLKHAEFIRDPLVQDGVIRQLEIIGEAAKNISYRSRRLDTEIPWKDITGMRDKLIHEYFGVDLEVVWDTIRKDIPELKKQMKKLMHP